MLPPVLVLCNDYSLAAAKTSRHLCRALERIGRTGICRDTRICRWAAVEAGKYSAERRNGYEDLLFAKWHRIMFDYGVETVISLDLHWLFSARIFLPTISVTQIHSFWFDDLRTYLQSAPSFPLGERPMIELLNDDKVRHHAYGRGQMEELRLLGIKRLAPSALAAPAEYLDATEPCTERARLAFVGNPGLPNPPTARGLQALERGENLAALRQLARQEVLDELSSFPITAPWLTECPPTVDLLAAAMELRLARPHAAAVSLLLEAAQGHTVAFEYLNRRGSILDAALLVKLVNRYDRPALALRLYRRGLLDVFGTPEQWAPYGITARPTVTFPDLAAVYSRYVAHLNAANCARDATANEKLFEIAACGRLSLNLDSPDVRACYSDKEVDFAPDDEALEARAVEILRHPDEALARGAAARRRTANEHLWAHRLAAALA
jgi:hypothetical protein